MGRRGRLRAFGGNTDDKSSDPGQSDREQKGVNVTEM